MAAQAVAVSLLQTAEILNVTPGQQGLAGLFFVATAAITTIIGKR